MTYEKVANRQTFTEQYFPEQIAENYINLGSMPLGITNNLGKNGTPERKVTQICPAFLKFDRYKYLFKPAAVGFFDYLAEKKEETNPHGGKG